MVKCLKGKPYEDQLSSLVFSLEETGGPHCSLQLPFEGKRKGEH